MKRGARLKTLRFKENNAPDSREELDNMPKDSKEELPIEKKNNEVTFEKVEALNVGDSPLMEAMIERKGGDDFLYKDQSTSTVQPETQSSGSGNNTPPPPPTTTSADPLAPGSPKEFAFDPIAQNPVTHEGEVGTKAPVNDIPSEISDESAKMMADMILEGFGMIAPEMADRYSKINEGEIRKLERDDKIQTGLVEIVKSVNKENKGAVKVTNEQKNLIRKPLIKVLEVQGVKSSPETMLIIAIIAVCVMLFIQARGIKASNDLMVSNWMADHSKSKKLEVENESLRRKMAQMEQQQAQEQQTVEEMPYAKVEVVG